MEDNIVELADETLQVFSKVEEKAGGKLNNRGEDRSAAVASVNTFTGAGGLSSVNSIVNEELRSLATLLREPAVSRVTVEDEDGVLNTLYICRASSIKIDGIKLAGYRTVWGQLASRDAGDDVEILVDDKIQFLRVVEKLDLHPKKTDVEWDSVNTVWRRIDQAPQTVRSFRELLSPQSGDAFAALWAREHVEGNIVEGLRHQVRDAMALRDQATLDRFQDAIFRLPLDRQLIILGPPGTGKTTTLIKRLGQKLDWNALDGREQRLLDRSHYRSNWIMFTPSELLMHYLKEAFNQEAVPASQDHIKTWDSRRRELSRSVFAILKTNTGKGLVLKMGRFHCGDEVVANPSGWYETFKAFHQKRLVQAIEDGSMLLIDTAPEVARGLVNKLLETVANIDGRLLNAYVDWFGLEREIDALLKVSKTKTDELIRRQGNLLYNANNKVFAELASFLAVHAQDDDDEGDDLDASFDEDNSEDVVQPTYSSTQKAMIAYQQFLQTWARTRHRGRLPAKNSRAVIIRDWLGLRVPSDDWFKALGREIIFQNALRRFRNGWRGYVLDVPRSYRAFRKQCLADGQFNYHIPEKPEHIDSVELDSILLLMLRSARELIALNAIERRLHEQRFTELARIANQFQDQVLVDEATDFSVLQLACMASLTSIKTQSFFACGDFNQRISGQGVHSLAQLTWISGSLEIRRINTVYRQSRKLNAFACRLLHLMGGDLQAAGQLPEYSLHEGEFPVLGEGMDESAVVEWLAERIGEIETTLRTMPTIAVLMPSESRVKPIAEALNARLETINQRAVACVDGQSLGEPSDVRVFDVQHVKGLEFEAVFFVDVDQLAAEKPELFERYLYVGATRAATYLGITCRKIMPTELSELKNGFVDSWISR